LITLDQILIAFIPVFVAVDAVGTLPLFMELTVGLDRSRVRTVIIQSMITALLLASGFIFLGKIVFRTLGITVGDFMIAGGFVLLAIAMIDILLPGKRRRMPSETPDVGAVPLGTPLIVGPAVLTTSLLLIDQYGLWVTLIAVLLNILFAGIIFFFADIFIKLLGRSGARALSKVMALLLAAIAVMMIRKGIFTILP